MKDYHWILHHLPYVLIGIVTLYLISEPGRHPGAPFWVYLLFLPLPLFFAYSRFRRNTNRKQD